MRSNSVDILSSPSVRRAGARGPVPTAALVRFQIVEFFKLPLPSRFFLHGETTVKTTDEIKARREKIKLMRAENPEIEAREIATILNVGFFTIVSDLKYLREKGLIARKRTKITEAVEARVLEALKNRTSETQNEMAERLGLSLSEIYKIEKKLRAAGKFAEKKHVRTFSTKTRRAMVCDFYLKNPHFTSREIAKRLNLKRSTVQVDLTELRKEGRIPEYLAPKMTEIEARVYVVIKKNPTATCSEIMKATGFAEHRVRDVKRRLQRKGLIEKRPVVFVDMFDEALEKKRVLRESWYVEEVCGAGFPGMQLPREYWLRYLALYEKKKSESTSVNVYIQNKLNS